MTTTKMSHKTTVRTAAEKMAFFGPLYNNVRHAGHRLGLLLGEGLIGTIALAIASKLVDGEAPNVEKICLYSRECGAQDRGVERALTEDEVGSLLMTLP